MIIEPKNIFDAYSTPIVQQTSFWSQVKERLGLHSCAYEFNVRNRDIYEGVGGYSSTNADFIMSYQYINNEDYVAYVPYGPEIEPSENRQGVFLEELSEILRSYLPKNCIALRYDLNWESHWCKDDDFDENGNWRGEPQKVFQEMKLNYGTVNHNLYKSNNNILPANTIVVDLTADEDTILGRMKPKTRYNIRLALNKGVEVRSVGIDGLQTWYNLYKETAARNGLTLNDFNCFHSMFASKMGMCDDDVDVQLLIAYYDEMPLAAMFLVLSAHRATYLFFMMPRHPHSGMSCPHTLCSGRRCRLPKPTNVGNTTCSASPQIPTLPTLCTGFSNLNRASEETCSINLVAGTTHLTLTSTNTSRLAR